ncbi:MAG: hypothetical protein HUJ54_10700 [Erysipelotrichaceae bacterium]|nr:hypothetical protein [Erysipelotrichaceae bacterium]
MSKVRINAPVSGYNVYQDKKNRIIYFSPVLKKAWYIPQSGFQTLTRFKSRYLLDLAVLAVTVIIFQDWFRLPVWIPVAVSAAIAVGLEYGFYHWLNRQAEAKNFDPSKVRRTLDLKIEPGRIKGASIRMVLYFLIGILIVVNAIQQKYQLTMMIFCWIACIALCGYGVFMAYRIWISTRDK